MNPERSSGHLFRQLVYGLGLAVLLFAGWAFVRNDFYLRLMIVAGLFIIVVVPLDLLIGYMGYMSFGQAAFFGVGAYIVGNMTVLRFEFSFWTALVAVVIVVAALSYLLSFPLFRLKGVHFAIGTLAIGQLAYVTFDSWEWFSGGVFGINGIARPSIGSLQLYSNSRFYILVAAVVFLAVFLSWRIASGRIGRAIRSIRQDEVLSEARGLNVLYYKRLTFVYACVFSGVAGALFAPLQLSIDPSSFTIWASFQFIIVSILGGAGTLVGPAVGAIFYTILDQAIQEFGKWNQLVLGTLLVLIVLFFKGGLWGGIRLLVSGTIAIFSSAPAPSPEDPLNEPTVKYQDESGGPSTAITQSK